ncbi:MAG: 23S rRNA (adenine(2503)-C(2))-methyltransferase RlmN [Flavobacteriales bacterium]|jgi:23S rRNA (adenine2503-C2)-methyltransferase|tara:strand:+ start:6339 stop:7382 length:1044 start_codon:yes stop_codon:yes gene_type:complete
MEKITKKNIRALSQEELIEFFLDKGEQKFRANQVFDWVWKKSFTAFENMSNISVETREMLEEYFYFNKLTIDTKQVSTDGTIKCAFKLYDGSIVEGVLIPTKKRMTACISSQVGCSLACSFCATGRLKRMRNLTYDEIYDQVVEINNLAKENYNKPLTNIVYMGMGEPLLNYKNTLESINKITSDEGLGMASRRITVSTAGIAKMIKKLGDDDVKFNLALSLHATNDEARDKIMEINQQNSLGSLAEALKYYYDKTGNMVTYEYCLLDGVNDSLKEAHELVQFCQHVPSKVNLIEYNPIEDGEFDKSDSKSTERFAAYLEKNGVPANVRRSRGKDIDAACGQLANKD